jgi:hypothetical protein
MRRYWGQATTLVGSVLIAWSVLHLHSNEPVYAGRRLTDCLDSGTDPALMAVHDLGPAATPWVLRKVRWEHPHWGRWQTYQKFWNRIPPFGRGLFPKPRVAGYDEVKAATALVEVGPQVLPQLSSALKENNPAVRMTCALALGALSDRGFTDTKSIAALRAALEDAHPEVRQQIQAAIAKGEARPRQ